MWHVKNEDYESASQTFHNVQSACMVEMIRSGNSGWFVLMKIFLFLGVVFN